MNVKVLTNAERKEFNERYLITLKDDLVFVKVRDYGRTTSHSLDETILLNNGRKRIRISSKAICIWCELLRNVDKFEKNFTLIDVQNAVNSLMVSYQHIDNDSVLERLIKTKEKEG